MNKKSKRNLLENDIEKKRQEMIQIGLSKGFLHIDTLEISQYLDKLMNDNKKAN